MGGNQRVKRTDRLAGRLKSRPQIAIDMRSARLERRNFMKKRMKKRARVAFEKTDQGRLRNAIRECACAIRSKITNGWSTYFCKPLNA